ncbi:Phosphorylated carbohydrates phosphatase [Planctomycetes bacterium Pan216]|uniref:Phosphorylated carbohydrates phosphatase n=1 Tax=Kolteria novifilia TaxID=2527975 RepID=A0A518B8D9_9BACT|nr:Phosphorylated carbohydrates phosphatase [Planctomycetes bacterium Pan216]
MTEILSPDAVVFDMDGLMIDTERLYVDSEREMLEKRGRELDFDNVNQIMGLPGRLAMERMRSLYDLEDTPEDLLQELRSLVQHRAETDLRTLPGLEEILARLEECEIPKAVATSTNRPMTEVFLAKIGLRDRFAFVLTGDDVTHGKPDPEIYLKAAATFGFAPERIAVLEDSINGSTAAARAGCKTVAIPNEFSRDADYEWVDLVAEDLRDERLWRLLGIHRSRDCVC